MHCVIIYLEGEVSFLKAKDFDTFVLYAALPDGDVVLPIHPDEREREILGCKSTDSRREKYFAWKLLELAVTQHLRLNFDNLRFTKNANGKWVCPDFEFSISHTDGLVAVAISRLPVGVDAELIRPLRTELAERILTQDELVVLSTLGEDERTLYLFDRWVRKESIFKMNGGAALLPNRIDTDMHPTRKECLTVNGREYVIALASSEIDKALFKYMEEI